MAVRAGGGSPDPDFGKMLLGILDALIEFSPSYPPPIVKRVGGGFVFPDLEKLPDTVRRVFGKRAKETAE